jgi:hypothetical protein
MEEHESTPAETVMEDTTKQKEEMEKSSEPIEITSLRQLIPDGNNANRHTQRGMSMLERSVREFGFADSMTVDKHGNIISGNGRTETLVDIGMEDAIVVKSDGTRPIIHQRTDLDLKADDSKARQLAILANRVSEVNLEWSPDVLLELNKEGVDLDKYWSPAELQKLARDLGQETELQAYNASADKAYLGAHKTVSKCMELITGHLSLDKITSERVAPELLELRAAIDTILSETQLPETESDHEDVFEED